MSAVFYKRKEVLRPIVYNLHRTRALTERRPCDGSGIIGWNNRQQGLDVGETADKQFSRGGCFVATTSFNGSRVRPRTVLIASVTETGIRKRKLRCSSTALVYLLVVPCWLGACILTTLQPQTSQKAI